jgi:hypothetical protein
MLAGTWAVRSAARATDLMHRMGGTNGIYARNRLERHFRDAQTVDTMSSDVFGIAPHTSHQSRAQRVEEEEPNEVDTRAGLNDAAIMNRKAVVGGQREIDPVVILRYSFEWSWTMLLSSSRANDGTLGLLKAPVATTTFSANSVCCPLSLRIDPRSSPVGRP